MPRNKPLVTLLEENEANVGKLYSIYAKNIPEKKVFWERLSEEEMKHAAKIGDKKCPPNSIKENKFSRDIIKHVMDFVLREINYASKTKTAHHHALLSSLRIERSLLEQKNFEVFATSGSKIKQALEKLNKDTKKHIEVLMKEIQKSKFPL